MASFANALTEPGLNYNIGSYEPADDVDLSALQAQINAKINRTGDIMTGPLIQNADPIDLLGTATKQYVDTIAGITFDDGGFYIYNTDDNTKQMKFNVANITTGTTRTYTVPNENGTLALLSDINNQFPDDTFAIYDNVDLTKSVRFETSSVTTGSTRTLTIPDASGTIALTSQLFTPPTTFADNNFAVYDDLIPSKVAQFDASAITTATTRVFGFPDISGTLALTSNIPNPLVLSAGANIDPLDLLANTIAVIPQFGDTDFQIKSDLTPTAGVRFDASAVLVDQVVTLQSISGTMAYLADIVPSASLSAGEYIDSTALTTTDTITVIPHFDTSDFEVYDTSDNTKRVAFATDNITTSTTREMRFPDIDQTLVGTTADQTLTNKSIDMTGRSITNLTDAVLSHEPATKNQLDQLASGIVPQGSALLLDNNTNVAWAYSNGTAGVGATLTRNIIDSLYSIDGIPLVLNTSVLFAGNFGAARNGYYICNEPGSISAAAQFTRDPRFDGTTPENVRGSLFAILEGVTYTNTLWVQTSPNVTVVGVDTITYETFSNTSTLTAGINVTINANAIDVDITQDLDMHNNKIINLSTPTDDFDAATKKYVDDTLTIGASNPLDYYTIKGGISATMPVSGTILTFITPIIQKATASTITIDGPNQRITVPAGTIYKITASFSMLQHATTVSDSIDLHLYRDGVQVASDTVLFGNAYSPQSAQVVFYHTTLLSAIFDCRPTHTNVNFYTGYQIQIEEVSKIQSDVGTVYIGGNNIVVDGNTIDMTATTYHPSGSIVITSNANQLSLESDLLTATHSQTFQNATGTIALLSDIIAPPTITVFDDNGFTLVDNIDNNKIAKFQLASIASGQSRTMTVPNKSGTLAMVDDVQIYTAGTNITIVGNTISTLEPMVITTLNAGQVVFTTMIGDSGGAIINYFEDSLSTSFTALPTSNAVRTYVDDQISAITPTAYTAGTNINIVGNTISTLEPMVITTLNAGQVVFTTMIGDSGGAIINYFEDSLSTSFTALPTSNAVRTYVDAKIAAIPTGSTGVYIEVGNELLANGGDATTNVWTQRQLNTVYSITNSSATLTTNRLIGLAAGTYDMNCTSSFSKTNDTALRLYNITTAAVLVRGVFSSIATGAGGIANTCHCNGRFTLASAATVELQYWASNNPASTVDLGDYSGGLGGDPVTFTKLIIQTPGASYVPVVPPSTGITASANDLYTILAPTINAWAPVFQTTSIASTSSGWTTVTSPFALDCILTGVYSIQWKAFVSVTGVGPHTIGGRITRNGLQVGTIQNAVSTNGSIVEFGETFILSMTDVQYLHLEVRNETDNLDLNVHQQDWIIV